MSHSNSFIPHPPLLTVRVGSIGSNEKFHTLEISLEIWQLIDAGMVSTRSTVRKVTVVTSTSRHSTRRPHRDHWHPGQPYHAHSTLLIGQYGARIVTYFSVTKLWFILRASARAVAPDSPIPFLLRLWKRVFQNKCKQQKPINGTVSHA